MRRRASATASLDAGGGSMHNHMVIQLTGNQSGAMTQAQRLDATFAALADPTRRAILARLATGEASVMELAGPFAISQPAISKHLVVLERAGLISAGREGQRRPRRFGSRTAGRGGAMAGAIPRILGGALSEPGRPARRDAGAGAGRAGTRKKTKVRRNLSALSAIGSDHCGRPRDSHAARIRRRGRWCLRR